MPVKSLIQRPVVDANSRQPAIISATDVATAVDAVDWDGWGDWGGRGDGAVGGADGNGDNDRGGDHCASSFHNRH